HKRPLKTNLYKLPNIRNFHIRILEGPWKKGYKIIDKHADKMSKRMPRKSFTHSEQTITDQHVQ
ncbi:hypothetical protein, partial [Bacillus cereus]|uniref:hypothetical protein n=1 Tax=Bacillus cereus TaxID=1396 RepID=UPI0034D43EF1